MPRSAARSDSGRSAFPTASSKPSASSAYAAADDASRTRQRTGSPVAARRRASRPPIKPVAPVTRIRALIVAAARSDLGGEKDAVDGVDDAVGRFDVGLDEACAVDVE